MKIFLLLEENRSIYSSICDSEIYISILINAIAEKIEFNVSFKL